MDCWRQGGEPGRVLGFVERDDDYLAATDAAGYFAGPEGWGELDRYALGHARGRVLDVGAGAGRHSLYLQEAGLDVTALDVSPLAAEVCRLRGVRRVFTGTVHELARESGGHFDSFLMLGNNLGLLGSREAAPSLLESLAGLASPDAVIVGEGTNPYLTDNPLHLGYHERNRKLGRMPGQVRMRVRYQDLATPWFDYLFTSLDELEQLLAGSQWRLEEHRAEGPGYVAVLRRRGSSPTGDTAP